MNIVEALAANAATTKRFRVPLRAQRRLDSGDVDPADTPPVVWVDMVRPDTLEMTRAGTAMLVAAPSVLPPSPMQGRVNPAAGYDMTINAVVASVRGIAATEDGEAQPVRLVKTSGEADPAGGRLYIGDLSTAAVEALSLAVGKLIEEGGDGFASFLGG